MSAAEKKRPTELIQVGSKRPRLYAVPKDKVKSLEKLIEEYLVENKNIPASEVFKALDEKYSKVGNILSGYRLRDGLTQAELAQKIKTSQPVIAAIENGKRKVGKTLAHKLAKIFNAKFESFLG